MIGGKRVPKHHPRIEAYGTVDELIAFVGLLRDQEINPDVKDFLIGIQDRLMKCAALLAVEGENPVFDKISIGGYANANHPLYDSYIKFVGITVNGDRANNIWIKTYNSNHVHFEDLTIVGDGYQYGTDHRFSENTKAIYLVRSYNITIKNCTITGNGDSLATSWPKMTPADTAPADINPDDFGRGFNWGIYNYPSRNPNDTAQGFGNMTIINNTIEYCHRAIQIDHPINTTISNNTIRYITDDAINIFSACENIGDQQTVISNNHIHDVYSFTGGVGEPSVGGHNDGIQFQGLNSSTWQIYTNMVVSGNRIHDVMDQGFWFRVGDGSDNWLIENNLIYKCPAKSTCFSRIYISSVTGLNIRNNTIINNGNSSNAGFEISSEFGKAAEVDSFTGNIIERLNLQTNNGKCVVAYENNNIVNIVWIAMNEYTFNTQTTLTNNNLARFKALFADYDNNDYTLATSSVAIGHADPKYTPSTDITGDTRDADPDAGCYEYSSPDNDEEQEEEDHPE